MGGLYKYIEINVYRVQRYVFILIGILVIYMVINNYVVYFSIESRLLFKFGQQVIGNVFFVWQWIMKLDYMKNQDKYKRRNI